MPRSKKASEPATAPLEAVVPPPPEPEPDPGGVVLAPPPITRITSASGGPVDPESAFRHVVGNVWEVRVRLYNQTAAHGRLVRTLAAHAGQTVSGEERRELVAKMR